ncbi:hypothetical protein SAMD00019534_003960 [Acytostelium subglobosum LB1]|uniref:hypothetical protein n=1 Tax=Acytostelium subglobosum LB1 TaxID=1410327 RepID=UPI000644FAB3|nr:hypothetical protein SAMD00019534_003960 [Acytostelium subglobosum LB1]GAM17221.1 hypothetical protein SAMD00019534_003960 [Acytostelium subglobosum LB1]|eukprot:XP_012759283.1 hypothetical protein SAMD00019534_003960 [Acytostelium subglobosum LB1]
MNDEDTFMFDKQSNDHGGGISLASLKIEKQQQQDQQQPKEENTSMNRHQQLHQQQHGQHHAQHGQQQPTAAGHGINFLNASSSSMRAFMTESGNSLGNVIDAEDEVDSIKHSNKIRLSRSFYHLSSSSASIDNLYSTISSMELEIDDLALELIIYIFQFLSPFDIRHAATVCKFWSVLCSSDAIWEDQCIQQWSWICQDIQTRKKHTHNNSPWKEFYRFFDTEYLKWVGWYQYSMTRESANNVLQKMSKGTFLIRKSSKPNNLVISYNVHTRQPQHLLVYNLGPHTGVFLNDDIGTIFPTLSTLVREKQKFLKRPYIDGNRYATKQQAKRDYIVAMMNDPKMREGKSLNDLCLLHKATKWCFLDLVEQLVHHKLGIDINHVNPKNGRTPLHNALSFIHGEPLSDVRFQIVSYLLSNGVGSAVNIVDNRGRTALHIAVKQHQSDFVRIVELLLEHGANINMWQSNGLHPLHIATKENNLAMVKALLKNKNVDVNCRISETPCSVNNLKDHIGDTPLHMAAHGCMYPLVKEMLECKNIEVNILDNSVMTPLHRAVLMNQDWLGMTRFGKPSRHYYSHQVVELLFDHGADPDVVSKGNNTPLHISIAKGHRQSTLLLMKKIIARQQATTTAGTGEEYQKKMSVHYNIPRLMKSIEIGSTCADIMKARDDLGYAIMCGFKEIAMSDLNKTITNHFESIRNSVIKHMSPSPAVTNHVPVPPTQATTPNNQDTTVSLPATAEQLQDQEG